MVCLDVDGTLLNSHHQVTPATRRVIADTMVKGILVVLVSARMPGGMEPIRKLLNIQNVLVCYSGALILENSLPVYNAVLPVREVQLAVKTACHLQVHVSMYEQNHWVTEAMDSWSKQEAEIIGIQPELKPFSLLLLQWCKRKTGPNKMLFMADADKIAKLKQVFSSDAYSGIQFYRSKPTYLEAMPSEGSKRHAVSFLRKRYGIPREEILAIGDNENDLDMLQYAGIGVAMGNAPASVKGQADFVTATNDEDGVAFAIRKFI